MIEMSDDITALASALPDAQHEFERVGKDAANPHFNSRYASLAEIAAAVLPALNKAGITVLQPVTVSEDAVQVTTILLHKSGQWLRATHTVPVTKKDAQGVGSALTYARRQALQAVLTVAPAGEDDDAEAAVGRPSRPPLQQTPANKPTLQDRIARLERTLASVESVTDCDRAWALAADLRKELETVSGAGELARLTQAYDSRRVKLAEREAMMAAGASAR
jgi:ERF superfamily